MSGADDGDAAHEVAGTQPDENGTEGAAAGWRAKLQTIIDAVLANPVVRQVQAVIAAADAAGGPLLAAGLAFNALFAILPGLLLLSAVFGWLVDDPIRRAAVIADLVAQLPPLAGFISGSIEGAVTGRGLFSLIGVLGLLWGASNFYAAFDAGMARLFPGGGQRGFIDLRVRGFLTVVGMLALAASTVILGGMWSVVESQIGAVDEVAFWRLASPVVTLAGAVVAVLLALRLVPTAPPSWRAAFVPALVAGCAIGLLTLLFSVLAPRLIGGLVAFGAVAAVFGALIWLNLSFQILIWAAAWARYRRDRETVRQREGRQRHVAGAGRVTPEERN